MWVSDSTYAAMHIPQVGHTPQARQKINLKICRATSPVSILLLGNPKKNILGNDICHGRYCWAGRSRPKKD